MNYDFTKYQFDRNLLICGPTGVGKTYQARQLLDLYKSKDPNDKMSTYEVSDARLKQMVKSNTLVLRPPHEYTTSYTFYPLEMMIRCRVLLYDDLGVSDVSDAYIRDLTFILDERMNKGLITLYTTNLNKDELTKKMSSRIMSRLLYDTDVITFVWDDRRLSTTNFFSHKQKKAT